MTYKLCDVTLVKAYNSQSGELKLVLFMFT